MESLFEEDYIEEEDYDDEIINNDLLFEKVYKDIQIENEDEEPTQE